MHARDRNRAQAIIDSFCERASNQTHSRIALPPTHLRATLRPRSRWSSPYNLPVHSLSHTHEMLGGKSASLTAHSCPGPPPLQSQLAGGRGNGNGTDCSPGQLVSMPRARMAPRAEQVRLSAQEQTSTRSGTLSGVGGESSR